MLFLVGVKGKQTEKIGVLSSPVTLLYLDLICVKTSQLMPLFSSNWAVRVMELERAACAVI